MLTEIADGVLLRRSEFCSSNAVVVRGVTGLLVVDPGVTGSDLDELADDLQRIGRPVSAGFSTHPHWDHVLWHSRLGDVPRYATATAVAATEAGLHRMYGDIAQFAPGAPSDLAGHLVPLPPDAGAVAEEGRRWRVLEHQAHAPGHAAVLLADAGVLLVGDMLSDVEIPLLDTDAVDQCTTYLAALQLLQEVIADGVTTVVPGHGSVARGPDIAARIAADREYVEALASATEPHDPRLGEAGYGADWMPQAHRSNVEYARRGQC